MGMPMQTIDHFQQLDYLLSDDKDLSKLVPSSPWGCITWSMGTAMGMKLSHHWQFNPPLFWIALSPFLHFVGEKSANTFQQVQQLKASLLSNPETTLKLFTRGHGVKQTWMDQEITREKVTLLARSLDRLCEPMPRPHAEMNIDIHAIYGARDSLVNEWMVAEFVAMTQAKLHTPLEGVSHALFYEQPQTLRNVLKSELSWF